MKSIMQKNIFLPRRVDFSHELLKNITWNTNKPDPDSFSWKLWTDSMDLARMALNSKYVQGVARGNLDPNSFGKYSVQDTAYCFNAKNDYQTIENRAIEKKRDVMAAFAKARYDSYTNYVDALLKQWHISDPNAISPGPAAQEYINLEHFVANSELPLLYGIISMIPCSQLWAWLGDELRGDIRPDNIYDFWIQENDSWHGSYRLDNFVNEQLKEHPMSKEDEELALKVYRGCMACEVNFFYSACGETLVSLPKFEN